MKPVVRKFKREEEHDIRRPIAKIPFDDAVLVEPERAGQRKGKRNEIDEAATDRNRKRGGVALPVVTAFHHIGEYDALD
jgi:hypothetical protein